MSHCTDLSIPFSISATDHVVLHLENLVSRIPCSHEQWRREEAVISMYGTRATQHAPPKEQAEILTLAPTPKKHVNIHAQNAIYPVYNNTLLLP